MENKSQLTNDEKELIEEIKNGNKKAKEKYYKQFRQSIENIAKKRLHKKKEDPETEDLIQDIFMKLLEKIRTNEIKESLSNWTFKVARNYCNDRYRREKVLIKDLGGMRPISLEPSIDNEHRYENPMKDEDKNASRKYYRKKTKRNVSPELQRSLEISLDYVECLYEIKNGIGQNFKKYKPVLEVDEALEETKRRFNHILPRVTDEKMSNYQPLVFKARPQAKDFLQHGFIEQEYRTWAHIKLNRLINELVDEIMFLGSITYETACLMKSPFFERESNPPTCCGVPFIEFGIKLSEMKMSPPRLIYSMWSKIKEFKTGKKVDRIKIEDKYNHFKRQTKGTSKEFLFNSEIKLESLRQLSYRNSPDEKFYKAIVNFIYRKSFVEKKELTLRTIN